ncbi:MAG: hypothetical protein KKE77_11585 [Alphaproteobacteria bacterium]|jgi:hypothetical protein|nr:hypothetical protein [Alphaproteobacteria bacterium]MBU2341870.1 hypothetical protein [Alphaproteobacteria bacterium]
MHSDGNEVHVSETEASGGSKEGVVRWVLIISILLAIGLLSAIWIFGAATQGDVEEEATVTGAIDSAAGGSGDSTDSVLGVEAAETDTVEGGATDDSPLNTIEN